MSCSPRWLRATPRPCVPPLPRGSGRSAARCCSLPARCPPRLSADHLVETPTAGDALQLVLTGVVEPQTRTRDEVLHRLRDQDLAGPADGGYSRADRNGEAAALVLDQLAFAGMHAGPDLDPQIADPFGHLQRAADRAGWTVERGVEAVARRVVLLPAPPLERCPHDRAILQHEFLPRVVPKLRLLLDRPH